MITESRLADDDARLMTDVLGYDRYLTYGEDVSANVNDLIAAHVSGCRDRHPGDARALPVGRGATRLCAVPDERAFFERLSAQHETDGAYGHVQATRPDTLAIALNDSPAGLLAWLAEKLVEWSDTPPVTRRRSSGASRATGFSPRR